MPQGLMSFIAPALAAAGGVVKGISDKREKEDNFSKAKEFANLNQTKPVLGDDFADGLVDQNRFDLSYAGKPVIFGQGHKEANNQPSSPSWQDWYKIRNQRGY